MTTAWAAFYKQYQPQSEFIKLVNNELTGINSTAKDVVAIQRSIEKLKVGQLSELYNNHKNLLLSIIVHSQRFSS